LPEALSAKAVKLDDEAAASVRLCNNPVLLSFGKKLTDFPCAKAVLIQDCELYYGQH
jgi:hypothetical protein